MASGGTVETVSDLIFLGSKITADGDCSHEIKRHLLLSQFGTNPLFHAEKAMAPYSSTLAWKIPGTGGAWWAAVYGVAQGWTRLKQLSSSSSIVPFLVLTVAS